MNMLRRRPWVIMCFFSLTVGSAVTLWTGLNGWWLPFGISAVGVGFGVIGTVLWLWFPPEIS